jgi:hypothetical protein
MNTIRNHQLNEFKECFSDFDDLHFLEVWKFRNQTKNIWKEGSLVDSNLTQLLHPEKHPLHGDAVEGIRLIFADGPLMSCDDDPEGMKLWYPPLRLRRGTFLSIAESFGLPMEYLKMLRNNMTVFIEYQEVSKASTGDIQCKSLPLQSLVFSEADRHYLRFHVSK